MMYSDNSGTCMCCTVYHHIASGVVSYLCFAHSERERGEETDDEKWTQAKMREGGEK